MQSSTPSRARQCVLRGRVLRKLFSYLEDVLRAGRGCAVQVNEPLIVAIAIDKNKTRYGKGATIPVLGQARVGQSEPQ